MVSSPIATERRHKTAVRPRPMKRSKSCGAYKKKAAQSDNLATFAAYRRRLLGRGCTYARGRNLQTVSHYGMGSAHQLRTLSRSHQCGFWMHATSSRTPRKRHRAGEGSPRYLHPSRERPVSQGSKRTRLLERPATTATI